MQAQSCPWPEASSNAGLAEAAAGQGLEVEFRARNALFAAFFIFNYLFTFPRYFILLYICRPELR